MGNFSWKWKTKKCHENFLSDHGILVYLTFTLGYKTFTLGYEALSLGYEALSLGYEALSLGS